MGGGWRQVSDGKPGWFSGCWVVESRCGGSSLAAAAAAAAIHLIRLGKHEILVPVHGAMNVLCWSPSGLRTKLSQVITILGDVRECLPRMVNVY